MPGSRLPYVTSDPTIVLLLLQVLGLRKQSEEASLLPCLIGMSTRSERDMDEEDEEDGTVGIGELRYGCTITVEKAHFVRDAPFMNIFMDILTLMKCRMRLPIAWEWYSCAISSAWLKSMRSLPDIFSREL